MKKRIEYEFTADDVADYVRDFLNRETEPLTFGEVETCLDDVRLHLRHDKDGIVPFCEARESRPVKGVEQPNLSRFLPVRPDDVPEPPEGYAFARECGPIKDCTMCGFLA
jgi:hypothetical protein